MNDTIDAEGEEVEPTTAALVPAHALPNTGLTRPIASVEDVRDAFEQYQRLRETIIVASDVQVIQGKQFVTKSGWRKLAVVMGVSSQIVSRDYQRDGQGRIMSAEVVVRAIAPNGRSIDGLGLCDFHERCCPKAFDADAVCRARGQHHHCALGCDGFNHFSKPQHDIPATASTRALNRACADLFGFGEVSAEEVTDREEPAEDADKNAIVDALNRIGDEAQRKGAKEAFARQFGLPAELRKGQVEAARRFVTSAGGSFDPSPPAGVDRETGEIAPRCSCPPGESDYVDPDCPLHGSEAQGGSPRPPDPPAAPERPQDPPSEPVSEPTENDPEAIKAQLEARLTAEVAKMETVELTAALEAAGLGVDGNPKMRRARLVDWRFGQAMTAETVAVPAVEEVAETLLDDSF